MDYRRLGSSGLKVSILSYGAWVTFGAQMQVQSARNCMSAAYDAGVNFFDNAEAYSNGVAEELMGKVLKQTGWPRDSYIVSSKVFFGSSKERLPTQVGLSRKHVVEACHAALERLQLDYLDLYFCHRPDPETPIEEVVETMSALIRQGKVLYWGTSEWSAQEIMEAYAIARQHHLVPPTMEQPQYNMLNRERVEREYQRLYTQIGLGTTIWSPLASGLLTGKYNAGNIPPGSRLSLPGYEWLKKMLLENNGDTLARVEKITTLANDLGVTPALFAIAWCLKFPHVSTVITGASKVEQIKMNMEAVDVLPKITDEVMKKVDDILDNNPSHA